MNPKSKSLFYTCFLALFAFAACNTSMPQDDQTLEQQLRSCSVGPTVRGIDVSYFQGSVDWNRMAAAGVKFAFARVSDGTQVIDETFRRNWSEMKRVGIIRGAYQYFRPARDINQQIKIMVDRIGKLGPGDLPAVLDVEELSGVRNDIVVSKIRTWLTEVEKATGKRPIIYTSIGFWERIRTTTEFGKYDLWVANYGQTCPSIPGQTWKSWRFWQFTQFGTWGGINPLDINVFQGTLKQLQDYAGMGRDSSLPEDEVTQSIEVYWKRQANGSYDLRSLAAENIVKVKYFVDGYPLQEALRESGNNFPASYTFQVAKENRFFEVRGYDKDDKNVARGIGWFDVTSNASPYIKQLNKNLFEFGIERPPVEVARLEVSINDQKVEMDSVRVENDRIYIRHSLTNPTGTYQIKYTTYNVDGSWRGTIHRTYVLR